jgi:hypothetical protein
MTRRQFMRDPRDRNWSLCDHSAGVEFFAGFPDG